MLPLLLSLFDPTAAIHLAQELDPSMPAEDPMWWPRSSWLLLTAIALALLIGFIVWVLRNPPGPNNQDSDE